MFRREMGLAKYNQKKKEGWVREEKGMLAVGRVDIPVGAVWKLNCPCFLETVINSHLHFPRSHTRLINPKYFCHRFASAQPFMSSSSHSTRGNHSCGTLGRRWGRRDVLLTRALAKEAASKREHVPCSAMDPLMHMPRLFYGLLWCSPHRVIMWVNHVKQQWFHTSVPAASLQEAGK